MSHSVCSYQGLLWCIRFNYKIHAKSKVGGIPPFILLYFIEKFYGDGVTFPIGYSNGTGLYLPVSKMLPEGGYEVESYWEYGFPSPLAENMEEIVSDALSQLRYCGIN